MLRIYLFDSLLERILTELLCSHLFNFHFGRNLRNCFALFFSISMLEGSLSELLRFNLVKGPAVWHQSFVCFPLMSCSEGGPDLCCHVSQSPARLAHQLVG